jgi:hypothetical protein
MTKKQFIKVAENFIDFAGKTVTFKQYTPWYGLLNKPKYSKETAKLVGVGVDKGTGLPDGECLMLRWPTGHNFLIHYKFITYPDE